MTEEEDIIRSAHGDLVGNLYMALYDAYADPRPPAGSVQQAEEKFRATVLKARAARDRAIELLPPGE